MPDPQSVRFPSLAQTVAGELHAPADGAPDRKGAAIVVSHPMTGVKEQTTTDYARALAQAGFYALTFDAAYQGENIKSAVTFLATRAAATAGTVPIDGEKIGVLGICASGGYASYAAQPDVRIKVLATVSAADVGRMVRNAGVLPGCTKEVPEAVNSAREAAAQYRTASVLAQIRGTAPPESPVSVITDPAKVPANADSFSKGAADYYGTQRGRHPRSNQRVPPTSFDAVGNYDSFAFQHLISPRPVLMIAGSEAETLHHSEAIDRANQPKELFLVKGGNHLNLYDDLRASGPKLVEHFAKYLV